MKSARHAIILDIIEHFDIDTQEELAARLREQGVKVTQATVSRDIKELRLIKVLSDDGNYKYATVDKAEAGLKDRVHQHFRPFGAVHDRHGASGHCKNHLGTAARPQRPLTPCVGMRSPAPSPGIIRSLSQ